MLLDISPLVPTLDAPRAHPCQAEGIGPGAVQCGAAPASRWRRRCLVVPSHVRDCWLCGTHAKMITGLGRGRCGECAAHGVSSQCVAEPLDLLLLGHAGRSG